MDPDLLVVGTKYRHTDDSGVWKIVREVTYIGEDTDVEERRYLFRIPSVVGGRDTLLSLSYSEVRECIVSKE